MVLSYTTPKRERRDETIKFKLDGQIYTARRPKDSMLILLGATDSDTASSADKILAVKRFIDSCFTPADQYRIDARIRDHDDPLEFTDLLAITEDLAERFGYKDGDMPAFQPGAETAVPGRPFRGSSPAGSDDDVTDISPAQPNRAARRAPGKTARTPRTARSATATTGTRRGRALPE